jgi:carbon monoxide dehydrogenase subunit G
MHVVENSIDIARPAEAVFDYCSDMRTEEDWNPAVKTIELLSGEPVGPGSRFLGSFSGLGKATMEVVDFARPTGWTTATTEATLPFRLIGKVVENGAGSRLTMRIELMPTGPIAWFAPLLLVLMRRTAKGNMTRIKTAVENR